MSRFRAPVRSYAPARRPAPAAGGMTIFDAAQGMSALSRLLQELEQAKAAYEQKISDLITESKDEIESELERVRAIKKGDKGDMPVEGIHYHVPSRDELAAEIMSRIRIPLDGKNADEEKIAARVREAVLAQIPQADEIGEIVLRMIKPQKGEKGDSPDPSGILSEIVKHISSGKVLKLEHIDGLKERLDRIARSSSYVHGGGVTALYAGSGVTVTRRSDGNYTISAIASGITELTATGSINGTNTAFTFASKPSYVISDGSWMKENFGWTWNSGTLTATMDVAPNQTIYGIS